MGRYRRTVSFPNPIASLNPNRAPKSYHVRSVSLPCGRTHPLIPQLRDEITELRAWVGPADIIRANSARMVDGLARLKSVLDSLDDVLQLPQSQDSLACKTDVVEKLLEDFLRFVDVYEIFHASMLGLKQEISSAQVAVRRKDDSKLGLYVKAHKKIAGEVGKLISAVGSIAEQPAVVIQPFTAPADFDDELVHAVRDVHQLAARISEAVFTTVSGSFGPGRRPVWAGFRLKKARKDEEGVEEFVKAIGGVEGLLELRKKNKNSKNNSISNNNNNEKMKMEVLKRMQELEDCVDEMEKTSERVFRSLIRTRVSLLNILTHA